MKSTSIPDILLEQYLLEELPAADMNAIHQRLIEDDLLRARFDALLTSDTEIRARYTLETFPRIRNTSRTTQTGIAKHRTALKIFVPAAAIIAVIITAVTLGIDPFHDDIDRTTIAKGAEKNLFVYMKKNELTELLDNGSRVQPGSLLQLGFNVPAGHYCVIVSIDGSGAVTLHQPQDDQSSARVVFGGRKLLPSSYELDNAPLFERFVMVSSDREIAVSKVLAAAKAVAATDSPDTKELALDKSFDQKSVLLIKE
jgi:hypothetical protein